MFSYIWMLFRFYLFIAEASEKAFAYFWITDSCPVTVKALANQAPFEVLSLAGSIANSLQIWSQKLSFVNKGVLLYNISELNIITILSFHSFCALLWA